MKIILLLIIIYLFLIKPNNNSRKAKMKPFEEVYLTHRGFFNNVDIPENSLPAFRKTARNHMGSELDVQLTSDHKLVVFHDDDLKRVCGVDKKLIDCTYEELQSYRLLSTEERIPLFEEVLKVLNPDTPLIVEIKTNRTAYDAVEEALKILSRYQIPFTMESFDPRIVRYLKINHPEIVRGQLAYNIFGNKESTLSFFLKLIGTYMLSNFYTKPDYVAYDVHSPYNLSFMICSRIFKTECVAWTVKNEDDLAYARKYYQQIIFDSFVPSDVSVCD
ncbi:MAG: hypothetical protein IKS54_09305 [Erysipelotrichaceae bacterium]|nr:hypothetical protein [Erysipelotrichaceae bacterium]